MVDTHRAEHPMPPPAQSQSPSQRATSSGGAATTRVEGTKDLLGDIRRRVRLPAGITAQDALEALLCTISQHAAGSEARHVVNALPDDIRPRLQRCSEHMEEKVSRFDRDEFLRRIGEHLQISLGEAEDIASAVLLTIGLGLDPAQVHAISDRLPLELRELWDVRRVAPPLEPHPILVAIEQSVTLPYGVTGIGAFSVTMGTLTQMLPKDDAHRLVERLPGDLRSVVEPFVTGRGAPPEASGASSFLSRVAVLSSMDEPEPLVRAVFRVTQEYLRTEVVEEITNGLPLDLRRLWSAPADVPSTPRR